MKIVNKDSFKAAVAAIWTPKRIVLAATREIHAAGDVYFAMAGLEKCADAAFDAAGIIQQGLEAKAALRKRIQHCISEMEAPLTEAAQFIHDRQPEDFKNQLAGKDALEIIFCGPSEGEMVLYQAAFKTKRRGKDVAFEVRQRDFPNPGTNMMSVDVITAGIGTPVLTDFFNNSTEQKALVYPEQMLKKLMGLAIAEDPEHIGYPVNVLKLAADGATQSAIDAP